MSSEECRLPPPPKKPLYSDCCGGGCSPCVMDIYQEEFALWEAECARLRRGEAATQQEKAMGETCELHVDRYTNFLIESVKDETELVQRIRCRLSEHKSLGLRMGQHIIVRCRTADGTAVTRQYTPVSPLEAKGYFELLIKIYPDGQMSNLIKLLKVGDSIEARGPQGHLTYSKNKFRRVLMLCAGTGVAPMCQVIQTILNDPEEETMLRLVYACRSYREIIGRQELEEFQRYWNFSMVFVLSQEPAEPPYKYKYSDTVLKQRVNKALVTAELGQHINNTLVLVSGTSSFDTDMLSMLDQLSVPKDHIHHF